ncbi:BgTH12-04040 [Blumeria graminis f. sp. triticale]|uniref:Bgt-1516 n=3 Tax=Blumeria graminis TaxID=34373 RepID=A0A9X9L962_BLUGR|nr:linoleate diol synthase [Blumeria graminis f. sp. tritici 96224]CAD6499935.1 BgTH12-04040 [Blumeria graminis f. sp. triticale]VCU40101.1 Bgt-1516 [Blumeria graminis f. sp. tritici]
MGPGQLKTLIGTIRRKPNRAPNTNEAAPPPEKTNLLHDLTHLGIKNTKTVAQAISTLASGQPMNDKEELLENGVEMLQSLPANSGLSEIVSNDFISMLWNDLPHPPPTQSGPSARFRKHDGSGNNPWIPEMGKAGTPYSRSVPPMKPKGPNLPDPELVFEQLLKRNGPFREHPSGLNRLFFSFATIVIHECFQSSRTNPWLNETSSYVDLSTLYGNTENEQPRVRTYVNGLIYPDSIASERIMMMPPGVVAVLLLFSRNHNHIAENLLTINEDGHYKEWEMLTEQEKKSQDEEIFQIARNINVGFFASIVLKDYVAAILNTPRANSTWSLDLGAEIKKGATRIERGTGNVVSIEFVVLYHWHAALSAADDKWMEDIIRSVYPDLKSIDDVTLDMYKEVMKCHGHKLMSTQPKDWTFGGLERNADGHFDDYELGELIKNCIEEPAHAFGAHGTPASLKVVDIMGQLQARDVFNVCTMNEFRRYLNLTPYKSFEDWNEDKETARAAELLYGNIENLELYPGLMAEVTKHPRAGSGVCPGQTTGRGILDDAVALVRGDRFLSYDFNSTTLTNWGVSKLGSPSGGSYGGVLPELLMKGIPGAWTGTSIYALLPFYTPTAAKGIVKGNKTIAQYDLERPPSGMAVVGIHTHEGCKKAFEDRENFRVMYMKAIKECTGGFEFMLGWDDAARHDPRSTILYKAFFEDGFEANISKFFAETTPRLIKENSLKYNGSKRSIDIVRDVTNVAPILWLAQRFAIPLKTMQKPRGILSVQELFNVYLVLFIYQSFNIIPANEWKLREGAHKAGAVLRSIHDAHLKTQQGITEGIVDWLAKDSAFEVGPEADRLYHALNDTKLPVGDLSASCILLAAPVAGNITQQTSLLVDLYLSPGYEEYKARIIELSHMDTPEAERELQGFVYEGMRHAGVVPGVPRVVSKDITFIDGARGPINLKAGHTVLIATGKAAMDPVAFPNPEKLDPHRDFKSYSLLGHGMHFCFGARIVGSAMASMLREIFKLKNIRRAPGKRGQFSVVEHALGGTQMRMYLNGSANESPIPTTLTLEYDE